MSVSLRFPLTSAGLLATVCLTSPVVHADETARMSVTVIASGTDSTRSEGEWSKGTFSYHSTFTITLTTDGQPSSVNMYDPEYGQKMMAQAARDMEKMQNAMQGKFSDEEEVEPEERYLMYIGQIDCPVTLSMKVDEKVEGAYADVGGMQPYTQTFTAESTGNANERNMMCVGNTSVLDIKDNKLYRSALGFPGVVGHYVFHEANRGNIQDDKNSQNRALPPFIADYLFKTLQVAPPKGHHKATLKPTEPVLTRVGVYGGYEGTVDVDITWDFERIK